MTFEQWYKNHTALSGIEAAKTPGYSTAKKAYEAGYNSAAIEANDSIVRLNKTIEALRNLRKQYK